MQTVIETPTFIKAAAHVGMSDAEVMEVVDMIAKDPDAGAPIAGTGGCRKIRVAGRGKGKSGGYRVFTFYSGENIPVFLLTVISKGEDENLTKGERNALAVLTKELIAGYR